jgi:hypothetical protein
MLREYLASPLGITVDFVDGLISLGFRHALGGPTGTFT